MAPEADSAPKIASGDDAPSVRQFSAIQGGTVASILRQYKAAVTKRVWASGGREIGPVWQRDGVVRGDRETEALRTYIAENPARWATLDPHRPDGHRTSLWRQRRRSGRAPEAQLPEASGASGPTVFSMRS